MACWNFASASSLRCSTASRKPISSWIAADCGSQRRRLFDRPPARPPRPLWSSAPRARLRICSTVSVRAPKHGAEAK